MTREQDEEPRNELDDYVFDKQDSSDIDDEERKDRVEEIDRDSGELNKMYSFKRQESAPEIVIEKLSTPTKEGEFDGLEPPKNPFVRVKSSPGRMREATVN